jgi:hypothetical protein
VTAVERFVAELAAGIIVAGGTSRFDEARARDLAERVLKRLQELGPYAFPSLLDEADLRFVYQWDESPPLLTVMLWDEQMWRDMVRMPVPPEIDATINGNGPSMGDKG